MIALSWKANRPADFTDSWKGLSKPNAMITSAPFFIATLIGSGSAR